MADGGSYDPTPILAWDQVAMHTKSGTRHLLSTGSLMIFRRLITMSSTLVQGFIVTVYGPDPAEWIDLKRRKKG